MRLGNFECLGEVIVIRAMKVAKSSFVDHWRQEGDCLIRSVRKDPIKKGRSVSNRNSDPTHYAKTQKQYFPARAFAENNSERFNAKLMRLSAMTERPFGRGTSHNRFFHFSAYPDRLVEKSVIRSERGTSNR